MSAARGPLLAYHLGAYLAADQASVSVGSLAMRYGLSVFEGVRGYLQADGEVRTLMLDAHLQRLRRSLHLMGLPDPGVGQIEGIIRALLDRNGLREDVYVRPSVHAINSGDLNVTPLSGMTVSVSRMGRKKWLAEGVGMRATLSAVRKTPQDAFPSGAKCIAAYAGPFLASAAAKAAGYDVPLLLNHAGCLTEAPTAALFLVRAGRLIHAPVSDGVLPSVTAHVVCSLARHAGIEVRERHVRPEDLLSADEAFLCGTGLEIGGIASVDGRAIGDYADRPVTRQLVESYFAFARGEISYVVEPYDA